MNEINYNTDYNKLKHLGEGQNSYFKLSCSLEKEVINDLDRYEDMYALFWSLIESNRNQCQPCADTECYNRNFLRQLKLHSLNRHELYLLVYITTYFLDLIMARKVSLPQAYYILSRGHEYTLNFVLGKSSLQQSRSLCLDSYEGYLLSVLYYLLPDFEYNI